MIQFIISAAIVVIVLIGLVAISIKAMDHLMDGIVLAPWPIAAFACWVLVVAMMLYAAAEENSKGPCLHYETQMYWNAATKTMMPAKVCVERGEWVKP